MIQLTVLNGKQAGSQWVARRFPVRLGRATTCDVCLEGDGVWDRHAEITLRRPDGFMMTVQEEAIAMVNGQAVRETILRNGDQIDLGSARLRFALSPTRQRGLRWRETMTWLALAALCVGQGALIYWLVG